MGHLDSDTTLFSIANHETAEVQIHNCTAADKSPRTGLPSTPNGPMNHNGMNDCADMQAVCSKIDQLRSGFQCSVRTQHVRMEKRKWLLSYMYPWGEVHWTTHAARLKINDQLIDIHNDNVRYRTHGTLARLTAKQGHHIFLKEDPPSFERPSPPLLSW